MTNRTVKLHFKFLYLSHFSDKSKFKDLIDITVLLSLISILNLLGNGLVAILHPYFCHNSLYRIDTQHMVNVFKGSSGQCGNIFNQQIQMINPY